MCSGSSGTGPVGPPAADALTWSSSRAGGPDRSAAFVHPGGTPATPLFRLSLSLSLYVYIEALKWSFRTFPATAHHLSRGPVECENKKLCGPPSAAANNAVKRKKKEEKVEL